MLAIPKAKAVGFAFMQGLPPFTSAVRGFRSDWTTGRGFGFRLRQETGGAGGFRCRNPTNPMSIKTYYSNDQEDFSFDSPESAAEELFSMSEELKPGDIVTVWEGDAVKKKASDYVLPMAVSMTERAWDDVHDFADSWEFTKDEAASIQKAVEKAVDDWADANDMHPEFYSILRSRPIKMRFTNEDGDSEVVEDAEWSKDTLLEESDGLLHSALQTPCSRRRDEMEGTPGSRG